MATKHFIAASALALILTSPTVLASNFSFTGNFNQDNDVQFFNFFVAADSTDTFVETFSLNGGVNVVGDLIAGSGFDPYLAIFNQADGAFITDSNGKFTGDEAVIANFGTLLAGNYILALTQFDNVAAGLNLADGFADDLNLASFGNTPFTTNGGGGSGHWAVDIRNVDAAASIPSQVPTPGSALLAALGLGCIMASQRKTGNPQEV